MTGTADCGPAPNRVTHRHPRLEKPLGVAIGGGGVLVAVTVGLVAVVALTT
ncbi:hypothetical protein ACWEF9_18205 [Streptomyces sp. NPDC004980]